MPFPNRHLYLTFHWTAPNSEEGQFGLRIGQTTVPTSTQMDGLEAAIKAFWTATPNAVSNAFSLYQVKAALIEEDGLYPVGHVPELRTFTGTPGGASTNLFPLQVAHAISLRGLVPRGNAGRGRVYLPAFNEAVQGTGVWLPASINQRAVGFSSFLTAVNGQLDGPVVIMSQKGTGYQQVVAEVAAGNRPDVQRRRARGVPEVYQVDPVS